PLVLAAAVAACQPAGAPAPATPTPSVPREPPTKVEWFQSPPGVERVTPCRLPPGGRARFNPSEAARPGDVMMVVGLAGDGRELFRDKVAVPTAGGASYEVNAARYTRDELIVVRFWAHDNPAIDKPCRVKGPWASCGTPTPPTPPCIP